jgi:hypothetical protein
MRMTLTFHPLSRFVRRTGTFFIVNGAAAVFCLVPSLCFSQHFEGKVINQVSSALPYASIGVRGKSIGGISDAGGNFNIDLSKAAPDDSVIVSYLGYKSRVLIRREITAAAHTIQLEQLPYQLNEFTATGKREIIVIGNQDHSQRYTGWGDYSSSKGRIRGLAINPETLPLQLSRFVMRLHENTFDSVRFRIHILPLGSSYLAGAERELLKDNVFVTCKKDQKWVYVDLKPYGLVISKGIIAAVEWVDSWSILAESNMLTISTARKAGQFYERKTPEEPFKVTDESFSPTMYFETFNPPPK